MADRWERTSSLAGVLAVLLWLVGVIVSENNMPPGKASPQELLTFYEDHGGAVIVGGFAFQVGTLAFLWFLGVLRTALLAAEGAAGRLTATAYASGVTMAMMGLLVPGPGMTAAFRHKDISPFAAETFSELGDVFLLAAEFALVVFMLAAGLLALGTRALPRWLGWVSLVLALCALIPPIGWAALVFATPLWVAFVSVRLWRLSSPAS
jgi:hypothetical protein